MSSATLHRRGTRTSTGRVATFVAFMVTVASLSAVQTASATSATLASTADTYVQSTATTSNFGSDPAVRQSGSTYRGLIRFDTRSIPAGSVSSVTLQLYGTSSPSGGGIQVHKEVDSWTESGTTWATQPTWNATVLATSATPVTNTVTSIPLPVSSISPGSTSSFGLDYSVGGVIVSVASRESAHAAQLVVDQTPQTTAPPPAVTTGQASNITATTAVVNGSINPNGAAATCHFAYGPTSAYGRTTADQPVNAGTTATALSAPLSGLTPATPYNFRLECSSAGVAYSGNNGNFTSLNSGTSPTATPTATFSPSADTYVTSGSPGTNYGSNPSMSASHSANRAYLRFDTSAIPTGSTISSATLRVRPSTTSATGGITVRPTASTWSESTLTWANQPTWSSTVLATSGPPTAGTWLDISLPVGSVTVAGGTSYGLDYSTSGTVVTVPSREAATDKPQLVVGYQSAGPSPTPPSATTGAATNVGVSSADVSGSASANGSATTCRFDYGKTTAYGAQTPGQQLAAGSGATTLRATLSGLLGGSDYHYRLACTSPGGTGLGSDARFTTGTAAPTAVTAGTSSAGPTTAVVSGTVADNGLATTCSFAFGRTTAYGSGTANVAVAAQTGTKSLSASLSNLTPSTSYDYRLECTNAAGAATGANATFTTLASGAVNNVTKVLTIVEENHGYTQLLAQMPYLNGLAQQYGYTSNFHAIGHPSLPNYLALSGGSTFGTTTDCTVAACPVTNAATVFDQAIAAGRTAKVYAEDMTSNCQTSGSGAGRYAVRHTAWPYFTDPASRANCNAFQVPAGTYQAGNFFGDTTAGTLPNVAWLIPNLCNDAHDCSLATADTWLRNMLPVVFAGPDWASGHLAIVVTTDEDDGSQGNQVLTVVIHPDITAEVVSAAMNLYSITRFQEQVAGVSTYLNSAGTAADLGAAFNLSVGP